MPQNTANPLQVIDPVLTNVARRYIPKGFIYDSLVPSIQVQTLSGQYPTFPKAYWYQNDVDNEVKDRAASREIDFEWSTDQYLCREYALKVSLSDLERQQANPALHLEQNKTDLLSTRMALAREVRLAALLRDPAASGADATVAGFTSGNSATPSAKWDTATSKPEDDIRAAALVLYGATGYEPNTIVIPYPVAYNLATRHGTDTFRGSMLYTVNGVEAIRVGSGILPGEIHGMKVVIPRGPQVATGREHSASVTYSEIWGKHVRLLYVGEGAGWGIPSVAYKFIHTAPFVSRWRENDPDVEYIRQWERVTEKVVAPDAGYELSDCIS